MSKRYRVLVQAVAVGYIEIEANGTRAAARKARAVLTMSTNPVSHLDLLQPVHIETAKRGEEIPDDVSAPDGQEPPAEGAE